MNQRPVAKSIPLLVLVIMPIIILSFIYLDIYLDYKFYIFRSLVDTPLYYRSNKSIIQKTDAPELVQTLGANERVTYLYSNPLPISYIISYSNPTTSNISNHNTIERTTTFTIYSEVLFFVPFLAYSLYPLKYRDESYFEKWGYMHIITEYEFIKRILQVQIPLLIILTLFYFVMPSIGSVWLYEFYMLYLLPAHTELLFSVTAGLIWFFYQSRRKEFRYYFAKACIRKIPESGGEAEKMKYLINGLESYNKYLSRTLRLQINDVKKIYSKIMSDGNIDIEESIKEISDSFKNNNKLYPIKTLAAVMNSQSDQFLVKRSLSEVIQVSVKLAVTVIPVAVTLLQLLFPQKTSP